MTLLVYDSSACAVGWLINGASNVIIRGVNIIGTVKFESAATNCKVLGCFINPIPTGFGAANMTGSGFNAGVYLVDGKTGPSNITIGGLNDCE